jgi:hypothetical protein
VAVVGAKTIQSHMERGQPIISWLHGTLQVPKRVFLFLIVCFVFVFFQTGDNVLSIKIKSSVVGVNAVAIAVVYFN